MRVFGVDPGIGRTGFGIIDVGPRNLSTVVDVGCITTPENTEVCSRLVTISQDIRELLELYSPDVVAVEELYFAQNTTTGLIVAQARGVVLAEIGRLGVPMTAYAPSQVKQAVTGIGNAPKQQVQEMVRTLLQLKEIPKPDDAADALAVALCHTAHVQISMKTEVL